MQMFDALTNEKQFKMLQDALAKGEESGVNTLTVDDFWKDVKGRLQGS